jgi:hypothetical protein
MYSKYFLLLLAISISILSTAQKKTCNLNFHSVNSLSLLNGENEVSAGLQSVNGLQKGNWFAGVGVGLDYYIHLSVPLFADLRYEFGKKDDRFFAYADAGINFAWVKDQEYNGPIILDAPMQVNSGKFHDGFYTDAGLGYMIRVKNAGGLVLSLGHSRKTLREDVTYTDWQTQQPTTDIYRYKFNRIVVKVGWRF